MSFRTMPASGKKTVAVIQSSYIPWKGYFDIMHDVDLFVFYDDVQFTKQDWRSRNRVKSHQGSRWLTIPVGGRLDRLICDVTLDGNRWAMKHYKTLVQCYARTPHWDQVQPLLEEAYLRRSWRTLSAFNQFVTANLAREMLGICTEFGDSRTWSPQGTKGERLLDLLRKVSATHYVSGPAARNYLDENSFARSG